MLVVGLEGGLLALEEGSRVGVLLVVLAAPVVVDLVVVPDRQPGCRRVRGPQRRVQLVARVQLTVVGQGDRLGHRDPPHAAEPVVLVDVVADEDDQPGVLLDEVAVGAEVAVGGALARGHREPEAVGGNGGERQGAGAADRAPLGAGAEAIEVLPVGLQPLDLDVHRVGVLGVGQAGARAHHLGERLVPRHLPTHLDRRLDKRQRVEGVRRQSGPQHHPVCQRVARGHAELERMVDKPRPRLHRGEGQRPGQAAQGERRGRAQEAAPRPRPGAPERG